MFRVVRSLASPVPRAVVRSLTSPPSRSRPTLVTRVRRRVARRRVRRTGPLAYRAALGPGLIAANAGNDAGGIATYSSVGASYGYSLLWMMVVITVSLGMVQEMCVRVGVAAGKGLSALIREEFGLRLTAFAMLTLLLANGGTAISEFVGIGTALGLLGIPWPACRWWRPWCGGSSRAAPIGGWKSCSC